MYNNYKFETSAIRSGTIRSNFNEHSEALFLTSSFIFKNAKEAEEYFKNSENHYIYSRFTNPTVSMLQNRLAKLEGGEACIVTSSGMSAIMSTVMSSLKAGDHLVSSKSLFGPTITMFSEILKKFEINTTFVNSINLYEWKNAICSKTKMFFLETPSNPLTEISDIKKISNIANKKKIIFVVDNCFCSPALQQPLKFGANVVIHSATKLLDGQGRILGGAIIGSKKFIYKTIFPFIKNTGPTLSAFNAWILLKGIETLSLRTKTQSSNALKIAKLLKNNKSINKVFYPGLKSHPQHKISKIQQKTGGIIVSFEINGKTPKEMKKKAWKVINKTKICSITSNLGDTRTTITHPATTTHSKMSIKERLEIGISDGIIRLSIGLENPIDIYNDLKNGLK